MSWKDLFPGKKEREEAALKLAEEVLADFLEYGPWVRTVSRGQYMGVLGIRAREKRGGMALVLSMYDTGPLEASAGPFLNKYRSCYDPGLEGFRVSIPLPGPRNAERMDALEKELLRRIARHPMALLRPDGKLQTKL